MPPPTLTLRQLNRATLQRQLLLQRHALSVLAATERVAGWQSQIPNPPYIGLWTRLEAFERAELTTLMEQRQIVRAALMRSTLQLMTAADHQHFQQVLQPALSRALRAFFGQRARSLDIEKLVRAARPFIEAEPRTTGEIRAFLEALEPAADGDAMAYAVRNHLPLVQVPPGGTWGAGSRAAYTTAEAWLGQPQTADLRALLHRYLAAFGPASVMDFQAWSGLVSLKKRIQPLEAELVVYEDEDGKPLLDLPDAPLPDPETPAPPRFLPEYDNLLVAHKDRRRIIADADRKKVFLSAARVLPTILVDGFVAGTWAIQRAKTQATLTITPFAPLAEAVRAALYAEGTRLVRFVEEDAATSEIVFAS